MRNIEVQGRSIKMKDFLTNFMVSINVSEFFPLWLCTLLFSQAKYDTKLICLDDVVLQALGPGFGKCPANDKHLMRQVVTVYI